MKDLPVRNAARQWATREDAVLAYAITNGRFLRELETREEMHEFLRHHIDLADLTDDLADKYAVSDRAWHRFLNDIIKASGIR